MKRLMFSICAVLITVSFMSVFVGCGDKESTTTAKEKTEETTPTQSQPQEPTAQPEAKEPAIITEEQAKEESPVQEGEMAVEETQEEATTSGTIVSVDVDAGKITVKDNVSNEEIIFTVAPDSDIDLTTLNEGDNVQITSGSDGVIKEIQKE